MSGLLGIWNNANQKFLHDYEDWYNNEHLFERLSVSNINVARRFQGLKSNYNYFTSYEAKTYKTFFSEEYLKKLNKPTKKTKFVMEFVFQDMSRTVFKKTILKGSIRGAFCLIISIRDKIEVKAENQTLASITYQNFFKLYDKLAGCTGTAQTESAEFFEIYNLPVLQIPTNKDMIRNDLNDQIFRTSLEKDRAIIQKIKECNEIGQPLLVFTSSINKSEHYSNLLEKELKQNLSLKNVSVNRQLFPFGLKVYIYSRIPIAYGERILNDKKILGFIDKDGFFINKQNVDQKNLNKLTIQVFGWEEKFKKILSEIFIALENYELEIVKITFSPDGFLTVEEKDLKTIFLGFKPNLINYQLQIIKNLKNEFKKNSFSKKIDNIDLTNPDKPKIKVFKP